MNVYGCEETKNDEEKEAPFYVEQEVEANEEELKKYKDNDDSIKSNIEFYEKKLKNFLIAMS